MDYAEAKRMIMADLAQTKGIPVEELKPWVNYDPISIDEEAHHLARGSSGVRWTGD